MEYFNKKKKKKSAHLKQKLKQQINKQLDFSKGFILSHPNTTAANYSLKSGTLMHFPPAGNPAFLFLEVLFCLS